MYVIAGLGNPGRKYERSRHNAGFEAVDAIAEACGVTFHEGRHRAWEAKAVLEGTPVLLVKPLTFMNASGDAIAPLLDYYRLDPKQDLLVISDDLALSCGRLRVRKRGSAGGHNGLKSVIYRCGTDEFTRIRLGVGPMPREADQIVYVLDPLTGEDRVRFCECLPDVVTAAALCAAGETETAMNRFNRKEEPPAGK